MNAREAIKYLDMVKLSFDPKTAPRFDKDKIEQERERENESLQRHNKAL